MNCTYPVPRSTLTTAARHRDCGRAADVMTLIPMIENATGKQIIVPGMMCLDHSVKVAFYKYITSIETKFTQEEVDFLLDSGCDPQDLIAAGILETKEVPSVCDACGGSWKGVSCGPRHTLTRREIGLGIAIDK